MTQRVCPPLYGCVVGMGPPLCAPGAHERWWREQPLGQAEPENPYALPALLVVGVVGGYFVGSWAYEHAFVEGLTNDERRNIVLSAGTTALAYGVAKAFGLLE